MLDGKKTLFSGMQATGNLTLGNYLGALKNLSLIHILEQASERKRQSILRVELEWMKRGARARSTKQKGRIQRLSLIHISLLELAFLDAENVRIRFLYIF